MSKMGISTMQGYQAAQVFEALGLAPELVEKYLTGTVSRVGGLGVALVPFGRAVQHEQAHQARERLQTH